MKLTNRIEEIFAHAVALSQNGKLRSQIHCTGSLIYVVNQDQTVIMRFRLRSVDKLKFEPPISFAANDYDSRQIEIGDGRINFVQTAGGFRREKSCRVPDTDTKEIDRIFRGLCKQATIGENSVTLSKDILSLLDESLSHIEFSCKDGVLNIVQRNIYSGTVSTLTQENTEGFGGLVSSSRLKDFIPIGLRTNDFMALFAFVNAVEISFPPDVPFVVVESKTQTLPMRVILSKCSYDELGMIT